MLRQLQPDLLITGKAVTFDWPGLTRRLQGMATFAELPGEHQKVWGSWIHPPAGYLKKRHLCHPVAVPRRDIHVTGALRQQRLAVLKG